MEKTTDTAKRLAAWIRKPDVWGFVVSVAAIAIIAMAFFYPDASLGNQLRQHDTLQGAAIGQEAKAYAQANNVDEPRWTNSLFSGMPTFQISPSYPSDSLFSWITKVYGAGLPAPSNLVFMMMFGFLILMAAMRLRWYYSLMGAIAWGLSTYFIIIIGAGHIWKFVTLAYIPPTIAGIIMAYSGRRLGGSALAALFAMMQIQSNHVQMTYYFMFVIAALVIGYLCVAFRKSQLKQWLLSTAALLGAAILAVAANLPSLYNTYEYSKETMRGGHSELISPSGANPDSTAGLDRSYITMFSYGTTESLSLLIPNIKGGASAMPVGGRMVPTSVASLPQAADAVRANGLNEAEINYIQNYAGQYFGDPEGTNGPVYVGAIVFVFFLLGCMIVPGPVKWSMLVMTLLSVFLAMGRHFQGLTDLFIDYMPMYNKFRTVESILVVAEFCMPVLAVLALHKLLTTDNALSRYRLPLAVAFGIPAVICAAAWLAPSIFGTAISDGDQQISQMIGYQLQMQGYPADIVGMFSIDNPRIAATVSQLRYSLLSADALRSLLFILGAAVVLWAFARKWTSQGVTVGIIAVLLLVDLYSVNKRYLNSDSFCSPQVSATSPFQLTDTDRAILADTTMHYRVMDIPQFYQAGPSYFHKTIGGYHAAKLTRYQDLIDRHLSHFTNGTPTEADWRVLDMLNARYVIGPDGQPSFNDQALGNAWLVDTLKVVGTPNEEMATLGKIDPATTAVVDQKYAAALNLPAIAGAQEVRPIAPSDTIYITSYAPDRLTYAVRSLKGATAVFSEVFFPWGWKLTIDGDKELPLARVDYLLRAASIPQGSHSLEMTFKPDSVRNTVAVARVAVIVIYLLVLAAIVADFRVHPTKN